jgi:hypothetical protein
MSYKGQGFQAISFQENLLANGGTELLSAGHTVGYLRLKDERFSRPEIDVIIIERPSGLNWSAPES